MPTWELVAYDTEVREDRSREYTRSATLARMWEEIPRIQFTDSGHGIVFSARELAPRTRRKPTIRRMRHAEEHLARMRRERARRRSPCREREAELREGLIDIAGSCTSLPPDEHAAACLALVYGPDWRTELPAEALAGAHDR